MDEEYSLGDVQKEIKVVKLKIADNARMQLVASEHSDIMNLIFHRVTLKELQNQAEVLRGYKSALLDLLPNASEIK
ncbi:MAG: hypothetical protein NE328_11335 [Lentisphaeraceae bacterium]|nr:hypothetical protein [Lentisphaeraceae bacterium]